MGWMLFLTSYDSKKNERRLHGDSYVQKVIITQGKTIIKTPKGGKKGKGKKKKKTRSAT